MMLHSYVCYVGCGLKRRSSSLPGDIFFEVAWQSQDIALKWESALLPFPRIAYNKSLMGIVSRSSLSFIALGSMAAVPQPKIGRWCCALGAPLAPHVRAVGERPLSLHSSERVRTARQTFHKSLQPLHALPHPAPGLLVRLRQTACSPGHKLLNR